jgi:hypothetical protein
MPKLTKKVFVHGLKNATEVCDKWSYGQATTAQEKAKKWIETITPENHR